MLILRLGLEEFLHMEKFLLVTRGFEFYSDNNPNDYVQIPWNEVTVVVADVYFGGKYIPRFKICTKKMVVLYLLQDM